MANMISLRIDGELVRVEEGHTIFQAAEASGKPIPGLCQMKGLSSVGACRLCVVELAGVNRLLPSCTTPAQEGMSVTTQSARLRSYRRMILELLLAERNHICAVCVSNNHCELQTLAQKLGVTHVRYTYAYRSFPVDTTHPRCVRVCAEMEGAHVWDVARRGVGSRLVCELNRNWGQATSCTSCGKCVQVCPTGALAEKGCAVEEMIKRGQTISHLAETRGGVL
jgi:bidirectional [NiFe] hydrogenase diaphorase subunit